MLRGNRALIFAGLIVLLPAILFSSTNNTCASTQMKVSQLGKMPLAFTENVGQWDESVKFRTNAGGATMWFAPDGAYYQFTRAIPKDNSQLGPVDPIHLIDDRMDRESEEYETMMIKANFVGANPGPVMSGVEKMEYKCNYFIGNDPNEWHTDVPNYSAVLYEQVYDGIDLKYYGNGRQMEYDFIVSPGADFSQIRIEYEGAVSVSVNAEGELVVETGWGEVVEQKPVIYQIENGSRITVVGEYSLKGTSAFGFELENYNPALPLVIDPVLVYSTYLGGSSYEWCFSIAVDESGSAYVTGNTYSTDFPTFNQIQIDQPETDVFVTKLSNSGSSLIYSTYLGGSSSGDYGRGIAVDESGCAYVTGFTNSPDFPTLNSYQPYRAYDDLFVTKLSSTGSSLIYSTLLGGSGNDVGYGIAVDGSGSAYVTGYTSSANFPTLNPYQTNRAGSDVLVAKLSSSGSSLIYSTYLGGNDSESGNSIAVDGSGSAYVTGYTLSTDFPVLNEYQTDQADHDLFVTKLSSSGSSLLYSTYLGGGGAEWGYGIAVDGSGSAYVTGLTRSTDFPTLNPYQDNQANDDLFVTKLSSSGSLLVYSTYLGGSGSDYGRSIAVDESGSAIVTGYTHSTDFPTLNPYQTYQNQSDVVVTKLSSSGSSLLYSTYLGGYQYDYGYGIAIDGSGSAYVTGHTSGNFPTLNPYQGTYQGGYEDAFVTKFSEETQADPNIHLSTNILSFTANSNGALPEDQGFTISNDGEGTLEWSVDEIIPWLDLTPTSGTSNSQEITVSINSTDIAEGTFNHLITVNSTNATNSPQYKNVKYTIANPEIQLSKNSLSFSSTPNGLLPVDQSFTINNGGSGTLDWSIDEQVSWLDVTPTQGTSNSQEITVSINSTDLATGMYNGEITINSSNAINSPQTVSVSYSVGFTGACCYGNNCSIETEADCNSLGGAYQGDGTECDPDPCGDCLVVSNELCISATTITEGPADFYTLEGDVTINGIMRFENDVTVDMTGFLPEISGVGQIKALNIIGSDKNLFVGTSDWTFYVDGNQITVYDESKFMNASFQVMGFSTELARFTIDEFGEWVKVGHVIGLPYPLDVIIKKAARDVPFGIYIDELGFGQTYSITNGITTTGDIGPLEMDFVIFALRNVRVYWDDDLGVLGGSALLKIPGSGSAGFKELSSQEMNRVPIELHDASGYVIGTSDFGTVIDQLGAMGGMIDGVGLEFEFGQGYIRKFIITLEGSIPLGTTPFRITQLNGGIEDIETDWHIVGSIDLETYLPEVPYIGKPILIDDLGVEIKPMSHISGEGTVQLFGREMAGAKFTYDGTKSTKSFGLEGHYDMFYLKGNCWLNVDGQGIKGSGYMGVVTPPDLPWGFGWAENEELAYSDVGINNNVWQTESGIWKLTAAHRIVIGTEDWPHFQYWIGWNYESLHKVFKQVTNQQQTIEFEVPENTPQLFVVVGNDTSLFHYTLLSPSGQLYDSSHTDYEQFESSFQTLMLIDQPSVGTWQFETDQAGDIQFEVMGLDQSPTVMFNEPSLLGQTSSQISVSLNDYNDSLNVSLYYDDNQENFDGELITSFQVINNATVEFDWNAYGIPDGEYFIYCWAEDSANAPVMHYAPGSILIDNQPDVEIPQNLSVTQVGDRVEVSWDWPVSEDVIATSVYYKSISDGVTEVSTPSDTIVAFLNDLVIGQEYEFWAVNIGSDAVLSESTPSQGLVFASSTINNPPYFTLSPDSTWHFTVGQAGQYLVTADDADGHSVSFSLESPLDGMSLAGDNLNWTPVDSQAGYYNLRIIADDGNGGADTASQEIIVYNTVQMEIDISFSSPTLYHEDNMFVKVSNYFNSSSQISVNITNTANASQNVVLCNRISQFEYVGQFTLAHDGGSLIPVSVGDTLIASYLYETVTHEAQCHYDGDSQPSDITAPADIADIHPDWLSMDSLYLRWTAPGDDGYNGHALRYDLRYSYSPITAVDDYLTAYRLFDIAYPTTAGSTDSAKIVFNQLEDFSGDSLVYFVIKAVDEMQNWSGFSNLLSVNTQNCCGIFIGGQTGNADCDNEGKRNLADITRLIDAVYINKVDLCCIENGNVDGDAEGKTNLADITSLIDHVYISKDETAVCE